MSLQRKSYLFFISGWKAPKKILKQLTEPLFNEFRHYELEVSKIVHEAGGVEVKTRDGRKRLFRLVS